MPQPASGDRHVDGLLTNVSLASFQDAKHFVAPRVCPVVRVAKQSDKYVVFDDDFFRRNLMKKRARGTPSAGGAYEFSTSNTYSCDAYALHKDVDDDERRNADSVFELDFEATTYLTQQAMLNMEIAFATEIFTTSVWTGSNTGSDISVGTAWSNASGDPISDVATQQDSILKKTGQLANTLVCGRNAWRSIKDNSAVLDRIKHTQQGVVSEDIVASVMELDSVIVANASYVSTVEGASSATNAFVNTADDALLMYVPPAPGRYTPSAAYSFIWVGDSGMGLNEYGAAIKKFRMEDLKSDRIEINQYFDLKLTGANLGAYFDDVVS